MARSVEGAAIDACDHSRAKVLDRDDDWNREGTGIVGQSELLWCPDCPLGGEVGEWFPVGTLRKMAS